MSPSIVVGQLKQKQKGLNPPKAQKNTPTRQPQNTQHKATMNSIGNIATLKIKKIRRKTKEPHVPNDNVSSSDDDFTPLSKLKAKIKAQKTKEKRPLLHLKNSKKLKNLYSLEGEKACKKREYGKNIKKGKNSKKLRGLSEIIKSIEDILAPVLFWMKNRALLPSISRTLQLPKGRESTKSSYSLHDFFLFIMINSISWNVKGLGFRIKRKSSLTN
ncbi:hypothetical protein QQP08_008819 [Theobroma cacao]|nr:hypothetical protein QQP08_008819 [Theobroma cacao]